MNKQITNTAIAIFKKVATEMGIEQQYILSNPSPLDSKRAAIYIDGDLVDEYWGKGFTGWKFQDAVIKACDELGIFIEPYNHTIIDVYKAR